jgi:hypothetical protein
VPETSVVWAQYGHSRGLPETCCSYC